MKYSHRARPRLPARFRAGHNFCFILHDLLVQILKAGEKNKIFYVTIKFENEEDRLLLERQGNIFAWLEATRKVEARSDLLRAIVLPALLSDSLHFIYEALKSSIKGKLGVAYSLLRKPLQENLYLLEAIVHEPQSFADALSIDPLKLRHKNAGGVEGHSARIQKVLNILGLSEIFDAEYIAQLRYEKCDDGFDGICNHAMHLFTEHKDIRTEPLNINFIFSNWDSKITQWDYLYSRLPYLLSYFWVVVEAIVAHFAFTPEDYMKEINKTISEISREWWMKIPDEYKNEPLERFATPIGNSI